MGSFIQPRSREAPHFVGVGLTQVNSLSLRQRLDLPPGPSQPRACRNEDHHMVRCCFLTNENTFELRLGTGTEWRVGVLDTQLCRGSFNCDTLMPEQPAPNLLLQLAHAQSRANSQTCKIDFIEMDCLTRQRSTGSAFVEGASHTVRSSEDSGTLPRLAS
jgi:hypothetical protein